jgi:threonylcarbamoyladenosine tRNA methylthiotransferase MtaB
MMFGADIIAGFPTETEAMFESSLSIVTEADLTHLHVFPYSPRPGTPAARMPQVPRAVAKARAAKLRAAGADRYNKLCEDRIGTVESVLMERDGMGRTEQFIPITVPGHVAGELIAVRVTGTSDTGLVGEAIRDAA